MAKQIDTLSDDQALSLEALVEAVLLEQRQVAAVAQRLSDVQAALVAALVAAQLRLDAALRASGKLALDSDKAAAGSAVRAVRDGAGKLVEIHLDDPE